MLVSLRIVVSNTYSVVFCCQFLWIVHFLLPLRYYLTLFKGRRGRDRMVVGFTTTYAINVYHQRCCKFESRSGRGVQHYVIKFVSDMRQIGGFLRVLRFPPSIKLTATI